MHAYTYIYMYIRILTYIYICTSIYVPSVFMCIQFVVISHHIIPRYIMYIMTYISYHITLFHIISYQTISYPIITYHISYIMYHLSYIICHISYITYHVSYIMSYHTHTYVYVYVYFDVYMYVYVYRKSIYIYIYICIYTYTTCMYRVLAIQPAVMPTTVLIIVRLSLGSPFKMELRGLALTSRASGSCPVGIFAAQEGGAQEKL